MGAQAWARKRGRTRVGAQAWAWVWGVSVGNQGRAMESAMESAP